MSIWRLSGIVLGLLGGIVVTSTGTLGLLALSALLVVAVLMRWAPLMLPIALSATVPLILWTMAMIRCEPSLGRTCAVDDGQLALYLWDSLVLSGAIGGALIIRRLESHHSSR